MRTHYYVYYRMTGDAGAARRSIDTLFGIVASSTGTRGRLLVRRDDPRTWMEIYDDVADCTRFEETLAACVDQVDAGRWAEGRVRHLETFIASC